MADALPHLARYPRARLGHLPTPIDAAPRLSRAAGVEIGIKRDDCTGLAFGGNKIRQLEFYLGAARERGADCVLITGAVQSNFVRCAAAGAPASSAGRGRSPGSSVAPICRSMTTYG